MSDDDDVVADMVREFLQTFPTTSRAELQALEWRMRMKWGGARWYVSKKRRAPAVPLQVIQA